MGVTGVHGRTDMASAREMSQDGAKRRIEKQISELQEKLKKLADNKNLTREQKLAEKQAIEDQIRGLNDELRQRQAKERQDAAAERAARQERSAGRAPSEVSDGVSRVPGGGTKAAGTAGGDATGVKNAAARTSQAAAAEGNTAGQSTDAAADDDNRTAGNERDGVILTISHTKDRVQRLSLVRTGLVNRQRTAQTEDEKVELQKRIDAVSANMGETLRKISDAFDDAQQKDEIRKAKFEELKKEEEARREKRKVVISGTQAKRPEPEPIRMAKPRENFDLGVGVSV